MPNWTTNEICVTGDEADVREFLDAVRSQDQVFDFNRLIPMPELLKRTSSGRQTIDGIRVTSWYLIEEGPAGTPDRVRLFTAAEASTLAEIGYSNWYGWRVANWGTKWNADDPGLDVRRDGYAEITFRSAWSAPIPVLRKMIAMFPALKFTCRWMDEFEDQLVYLTDLESGQ